MSSFSLPPPPLDDPTVSDPLECPPLRWGILGCGRVSHDFVQALKYLPTQTPVACSARSAESAAAFAEKHGIATSYGSYDEMLQDTNVDIVYVGNVHGFRRATGEKCLMANKHVVLEKPFACSVEDAEYLIKLAKERDLFIMEGMWTRFFPAVEQARRIANGIGGEKPALGDVANVFSDFNFDASDSEEYPTSFVYQPDLGGGSSFLVAPYPIAAATLFYPGVKPEKIHVVGQLDEKMKVDLQGGLMLSYAPTSSVQPATDESTEESTPKLPGAGIASLSFGIVCESAEVTTVVGTKGRLVIESPAHCPTKLTVMLKGEGRGSVSATTYEYPLPEEPEEVKAAGGFNYPNSAGFMYEAAAVARCIAAGKKEAPQFTLDETLLSIKLIEEIRSQLGVAPIGK